MKKSSKSLFFPIWCVITLGFLLLIFGFLFFFWHYLDAYEKSTPSYAAEQVLNQYRHGDFIGAMHEVRVENLEAGQYERYVRDTLGDLETVRVLESKSEKGEILCELRGEGKKKIRFFMEKTGEPLPFGFTGYRAKQEPVSLDRYVIYAPENMMLVANDEEQTSQDIVPVKAFTGLHDETLWPKEARYEIGSFDVPQLSLAGLSENEYQVTESGEKNGYRVRLVASENKQKEREELAMKVAKLCARYTSKDAAFKELSEYLCHESEYYDAIRNYSNYWVIEHDSFRFEKEKIENFVTYSEDHFSCEVSFDYVVYKDRSAEGYRSITRTSAAHYRLYFVRVGENFLLANAEIF